MKKLGHFQKLAILTVATLALSAGLFVLFRYLMSQQLESIRVHREEAAAATRVVDVAVSINQILGGRDMLVEEIESLLPTLINVNRAADTVQRAVAPLFVQRPELRTGGVAPISGGDGDIQAVQFTIRGRIEEDNFDRVLEELAGVSVLLDVDSATLDMKAIALPNQGEATFSGKIFAREE